MHRSFERAVEDEAMELTARQTFPRSNRAPGDARRFVAGLLAAWRIAEKCSGVLLALSELVTNAVTHGQGLVRVRVALRRSVLRIEVEDEGAGLSADEAHRRRPEHVDAAATDSIGGRGLDIVAGVADHWGHSRPGDASVVWFETLCPR